MIFKVALFLTITFCFNLVSIPLIVAWKDWSKFNIKGTSGPEGVPGPREGHSLSIWNDQLILFGGRSNDEFKYHLPRTYDVGEVKGVFSVKSYFQKPVNEGCDEKADENIEEYFAHLENKSGTCRQVGTVRIGKIYNDVWSYNLACDRQYDTPCNSEGWRLLDRGSLYGGCIIVNQVEVCQFPQERYGHMATVHLNKLWVYGGFAMFCEDYCIDMWTFELPDYRGYEQNVYVPGIGVVPGQTPLPWGYDVDLYGIDPIDGHMKKLRDHQTIGHEQTKTGDFPRWNEMDEYDSVSPHPHQRWRQGHVNVGGWWVMFGGYRLWHGFQVENWIENDWGVYDVDCTPENWDICNPNGGYLDDLWIFEICEDAACTTNVKTLWERKFQEYTYIDNPGIAWDDRNRKSRVSQWPVGRAGNAMTSTNCNNTYREANCYVWMFGGYRVVLPYPETSSPGYLKATKGLSSGRGFISYPTLPYYLNDVWRYEVDTGLWTEQVVTSPTVPIGRHLHTIVGAANILILVGGYRQNDFLSDFWTFNTTTNYWLEKKTHVHEKFPDACTEDKDSETSVFGDPTRSTSVTPVPGSDNNTDGKYGRAYCQYVPPIDKDSISTIKCFQKIFDLESGTYSYVDWDNHIPNIVVHQPRKRKPGWDGCRDRNDGKYTVDNIPVGGDGIDDVTNFKNQLLYEMPFGLSGYGMQYHEKYRALYTFAGAGYDDYKVKTLKNTYFTERRNHMWHWKRDACPNNCTGRGVCRFGYCTCDNGYYGVDCSNISCPGDFCYYDENTHEQICSHCCAASSYERMDGDFYVPNARKSPCTKTSPGERHGICDGDGNCQCMQPFITDDCSVRDCPNQCSGHGWCSVEFPVSRCMCIEPYIGEDCRFKQCLNNCSYPNGLCMEGLCVCNQTYSPYNRTVVFEGHKNWDESTGIPKWMRNMRDEDTVRLLSRWSTDGTWGETWSGAYAGDDCSFQVVFAKGPTLDLHVVPWILNGVIFFNLLWNGVGGVTN